MDRLTAIQSLITVVDAGSFTAAADILGLPKATVSKQIITLEESLGVKLLTRTTRSMSLTSEGQRFCEVARRVVEDLDALESELSGSVLQAKGVLRVDMPVTFATSILMPELQSFGQQYPDLQLFISSTDRLVDMASEGIDCALRTTAPQNQPDSLLIAKPLGELAVITCAAPSYIQRHGVPKRMKDLVNHQFVGFFSGRSGQIYPPEFESDMHDVLYKSPRLLFNDSNAYHAAAVEGLGLIQNTVAVLAPFLRSGQLVQVLPNEPCISQKVWLVYSANRRGSLKVKLFADWCTRLFAS
jgi:LysR family transcriptional regulator, regulator for bpeEF and oprC